MAAVLGRRSFLKGLFAAPAIVAYQNIMPVKLFSPVDERVLQYLKPLEYSFAQTKEIHAAHIFNIRDILLPGLEHIRGTYVAWPETVWEDAFHDQS